MVAPTARVTLMGMVPIMDANMDHLTLAGGQFTTSAAALGDIKMTGLLQLFNRDRRAMHLSLGVSLPTGAVDKTGVTPAIVPRAATLPYPMQIGFV